MILIKPGNICSERERQIQYRNVGWLWHRFYRQEEDETVHQDRWNFLLTNVSLMRKDALKMLLLPCSQTAHTNLPLSPLPKANEAQIFGSRQGPNLIFRAVIQNRLDQLPMDTMCFGTRGGNIENMEMGQTVKILLGLGNHQPSHRQSRSCVSRPTRVLWLPTPPEPLPVLICMDEEREKLILSQFEP